MARAKAVHPRTETVLLRFTVGQRAVLEAAAYLATPQCTANSYVYGLVEAHIEALLATDELVRESLNTRAKADERAAASTSGDLTAQRARTSSSPGAPKNSTKRAKRATAPSLRPRTPAGNGELGHMRD